MIQDQPIDFQANVKQLVTPKPKTPAWVWLLVGCGCLGMVGIGALIALGVGSALFVNRSLGGGNFQELPAKALLLATNLGQEQFYQVTGEFSGSFADLDRVIAEFSGQDPEIEEQLASLTELNLYTFQITTQLPETGETANVMVEAQAIQPNLKSYTGAVFAVETAQGTQFSSGICETTAAATTVPVFLTAPLPGGEIECPPGSSILIIDFPGLSEEELAE